VIQLKQPPALCQKLLAKPQLFSNRTQYPEKNSGIAPEALLKPDGNLHFLLGKGMLPELIIPKPHSCASVSSALAASPANWPSPWPKTTPSGTFTAAI
jgi:hypothetical protein